MNPVDVEKLLADSASGEGQRCRTCQWLETRNLAERDAWDRAFEDTGSYNGAQMARAIKKADPDGAPGEASVTNHRHGHSRNRP